MRQFLFLVLLLNAWGAATGTTLIFQDNFDTLSDGTPGISWDWSYEGDVDVKKGTKNSPAQSGPIYIKCDGDGTNPGQFWQSIDTTTYENIQVQFYFKTQSLENGDTCVFRWSSDGGQSYSDTVLHRGGSEINNWTPHTTQLSATADNNPNLAIRFGAGQANAADYCWFDTIQVFGDGITSTTPSEPPASTTSAPISKPAGTCDNCLAASSYDQLSGTGSVTRTQLSVFMLNSGLGEPASPVDFGHVGLPADAAHPSNTFEGSLTIQNENTVLPSFTKIKDTYNYDGDVNRLKWPDLDVDLIQHGSHILPINRGMRIPTPQHEFWEVAFEPGRCWDENGDNGNTRCSLPFALGQRNANCVHQATLTFLFTSAGAQSTVSKVWAQLASETCLYYKFDFSGLLSATYSNTPLPGAAAVRAAFENEVSNRIQTKPISELANDYPGSNPSTFASELTADHVSAFGYVYNNVHYVGSYTTRYGDYPFPDGLIMPSYSTSKTMFGFGAAAALKQKYSNDADPFRAIIGNLVSGAPLSKWGDVTVEDCLDMATGNYRFSNYLRDEGLAAVETNFFLVEDETSKTDHALNYYRDKATPGTKWIYHTSDTYLAGIALQEWYRDVTGDSTASLLEFMRTNVWEPLNMSELYQNPRVTYDATKQPFVGWGMWLIRDDFAKMARFFNTNADNGATAGTQILSPGVLADAMSSTCGAGTCGLVANGNVPSYYNNAVWKKQPTGMCKYIPFMSGYGGITVALFSGGSTYYYVSDNDEFKYDASSVEAAKIDGSCL